MRRFGFVFGAILDFPDAFDVTEYTWESSISNQIGSAVSIVDFTIENVVDTTDQLQISLTSEQTNLLPEKCYWDIQGTLIADTSQVQTYMRGAIITTRQVTQ